MNKKKDMERQVKQEKGNKTTIKPKAPRQHHSKFENPHKVKEAYNEAISLTNKIETSYLTENGEFLDCKYL